MVDRITLATDVYMKVDGQWQVVLRGSQLDVPSAAAFKNVHIDAVTPNTGTLLNGVHATPVANFRTKR